ncbi:ABC transporter substrate-binding protein [Taklimakanibacter albus]|uniref:ABC transporter substrate-binding protein n=1 Tax=Taklimakanibacter albus TaxID=2800327 RepID=A0ACC5R5P5_9HYPH|nr:ABC transporter substrate-binding protein [Aestuariivirga sp. YIM B02566]MBK1867903.1 ABC transporter substrate-binding protein [Aestuariivirga sp. YIM B02566]
MSSRLKKALRGLAFAALALAAVPSVFSAAAEEAKQQYFPLATFRVGAYASSGIPVWAGEIDYFRYINEVEGGINGVKLFWDECETEWEVEKGVECYERVKAGKDGSPVPIFLPHGDPISKALTEKTVADKIPQITIAYGRTESIDGRVFPYSFPVLFSFWSEASSVINHIAEIEGGKEKLKGLKIATVYHDSPYGKETQVPLDFLAKTYGFENIQIPVPHPGNEQSAQWAKIRQLKPDYVFLRGWGVMTPVAIKTAAKTGFPVDHIIGGIWSGSEEDVRPAGAVGKGYKAVTPFPAGADFEILKKLKANIVDKGLSDLKDPKSFGSVYYNSGVIEAIISVEAIRKAQSKFGNRPVTGEEAQWGLENLKLDEARLKEIGADGLVQPLELSIKDHEGGGAGKILQWDGEKWNIVSNGWVRSDRELLLPLIYERAAAYAKEKGITPRPDVSN